MAEEQVTCRIHFRYLLHSFLVVGILHYLDLEEIDRLGGSAWCLDVVSMRQRRQQQIFRWMLHP